MSNTLSSQYNAKYASTRFFPRSDVPDVYNGVSWVDPFDPKLQALLERTATGEVIYDGYAPLTSLSQRLYGCTSAAWLILLFSGYAHPHDIPAGRLRVPRPESLDATLKTLFATRNTGTEIEV